MVVWTNELKSAGLAASLAIGDVGLAPLFVPRLMPSSRIGLDDIAVFLLSLEARVEPCADGR
ncbi:hypothetical protein X735_32815 [Mesorhizobium sp. L2C085B000]|nr:hypothetical protein X735_32815 [Mesorhizobium sp. L2C085B000]